LFAVFLQLKRKNTVKNRPVAVHHINASKKSKIVSKFIEILNTVKLYHWKTRSYAQHKATDELYENLNESIDRFVETLLGKDESRLEKHMSSAFADSENTTDFKKRIYAFRKFLTEMEVYVDPKVDTDLLSIRDEILSNINKFLYLMTLDK
jgi:DNA-binding ferritin-like protein